MMRIVVLSDTHSRALPAKVVAALADADLVIHAGDICDERLLKDIRSRATVEAVCGNMDEPALRKKLPRRLILKCEDVSIGVIHGEGGADHVIEHVQEEFSGDSVDAVVFGHSHAPFNKKISGIVYFNPGSPNDDIFAPYCSYGMIEINGRRITPKIIKVE